MEPKAIEVPRGRYTVLKAALGSVIATPLTMGVVGVVARPLWAALTLFGVFTLAPPSFISSSAIACVCSLLLRRTASWRTHVLTGALLGIVAAAIWSVALASMQEWRLSFGFGDPMPGSPPPDPVKDAWEAAYFLGTTGAVLGAWTSLIFWLIRRPDRDTANPPTRTP